MTVAVTLEGALLALALLLIVALLRSHAEILRRLTALEDGDPAALPAAARGRRSGPASDIVGRTLGGDAVKIGLGPQAPRTLLAFMSSGCATCGELWRQLAEGRGPQQAGRLVVVVKGPERERVARLRELAPPAGTAEVVMSTEAYADYEIEMTPLFVLVDGGQGIVGRGTAASWEQLAGMLRDADDDNRLAGTPLSTSDRAARAEQTLAAHGITPGHPSLYPSRQPPAGDG